MTDWNLDLINNFATSHAVNSYKNFTEKVLSGLIRQLDRMTSELEQKIPYKRPTKVFNIAWKQSINHNIVQVAPCQFVSINLFLVKNKGSCSQPNIFFQYSIDQEFCTIVNILLGKAELCTAKTFDNAMEWLSNVTTYLFLTNNSHLPQIVNKKCFSSVLKKNN